MPVKLKKLTSIFAVSFKETSEKCSSESDKMRVLVLDTIHLLPSLMPSEKLRISLIDIRVFELARLMTHVLYLSMSGLYRNAFDNIRYTLESVVQSLYVDSRHSNSSLRTRIEILKEVEDKREYRAVSLIDELEIDHKDTLKKQYKKLSQTIHPSHRSIIEFLNYGVQPSNLQFLAPVSCKEISDVFESSRMTLDMVLFLYVSLSSNARKEQLKNNSDLFKYCEKYDLVLLSKILKDQFKVKKTDKRKKEK